jgi:flagellar hook-associated protein 1 FlgK
MSLGSALDVALTGLQTSSTLLQLTANNISNAQTPGYTEKTATVSSTATGAQGGGVEITGYTRATNSVLSQAYNAATSTSSYLGAQNSYMQQVQTILNSSASNPLLSTAMSNFAAAWTQMQSSPEDSTTQQAVVQAGINLATQINTIVTQTTTLQAQVQTDTANNVTQLNNDLQTVQSLNQQIFTATNEGQPTGNLQDELDTAINQISAITNVQAFPRAGGEVALYTTDGTALLDGTAQTFTYNGSTVTNSAGQDVTNSLTGGSLQAELQFIGNSSPPSSLPGVNTIQKLQGQMNNLITALTSNSAGPPQTFENAYNPGGVAADNFFTTTGGFAVNSALVADPTTITETTATATANSFATNFNFSDASTGLALSTGTYSDLANTILSGFQQAANTVQTQSQSATQQQTYYQQSLSNAVGVNVDTELVNLTTLQNSYAASAHVISTINLMFNDLMATI